MAEVKNTFLKGRMNQDIEARILPDGEYREAINLLISRSAGSTVGEFENVEGNIIIGTGVTGSNMSIIGKFVDEITNTLYVFATNFSNTDFTSRATNANTCLIASFNLTTATGPQTLVSGHFLNFNKEI